MRKRGQVTFFVIVGLVVLTTVLIGYYAKDYVLQNVLKREVEESIIVPEKVKPIHNFILSCLRETGEKGVKLLGQQGGYITIPRDPYALTQLNLASNALTIYGNNKVAYWFYEQPNKVQFRQVPTKKDMEKELSSFVENDILNCLDNFKDFNEYEIKQGNLNANSVINKNEISVSLDFPVEIKIRDFEFDMNRFSQKISSPLLELYEKAKELFTVLDSENILEHKTKTMMVVYDEVPLSGTTDDCVPPVWTIDKVREDFKKIISTNVQVLKVKGTNYRINEQGNDYFVIEPDLNDANLDVNFLYSENWPLEIDVNPRDGNLLKGQSVTSKLGPLRGLAESFACASTYHFIWDVKYPVLVILGKDEYTFQFGTQVVIDNNEPRKSEILGNSIEGFDNRICEARKQELTVFTKDINDNPLDDVTIEYKCISKLCDIGKTSLNSLNDAVLTEKYPQCLNGALVGTKTGYHPSKLTISTLEKGATTLFLEPYRELDVDVLVERAGSGKVDKNEQVYIQISEEEKDHYETILYPEHKKIKLITGDYKATVYIISDFPEGLDLRERQIENCFDVPKQGVVSALFRQTEKKCVKTTIPATTVNKIISGYTEIEFSVSESDLNKKKVVFFAPYIGKPTTLSQLSKAFEKKDVQEPRFE